MVPDELRGQRHVRPPRPAARGRRVRARHGRDVAGRLPRRRRRAPGARQRGARAGRRRAGGADRRAAEPRRRRPQPVRRPAAPSPARSSRVFTRPMVGRGHANGTQLAAEGHAATSAPRSSARSARRSPRSRPDGRLVARHDAGPGLPDPLRRARHPRPARWSASTPTPARTAATRSSARSPPAARRRRPCWTWRAPTSRGFVLYAPVYKPGGRHLMEDVVGVVAGSFSVADARLRGPARGRARDRRARAARGRRRAALGSRRRRTRRRPRFSFAGRTWSVQSQAAPRRRAAARPGHARRRHPAHGRCCCWRAGRAPAAGCPHTGRRDRDRAERRFLDTFSSAPIGMALVSPAGEVLRVNRAFCDLLGRSEDELRGRPAPSVIVERRPRARPPSCSSRPAAPRAPRSRARSGCTRPPACAGPRAT